MSIDRVIFKLEEVSEDLGDLSIAPNYRILLSISIELRNIVRDIVKYDFYGRNLDGLKNYIHNHWYDSKNYVIKENTSYKEDLDNMKKWVDDNDKKCLFTNEEPLFTILSLWDYKLMTDGYEESIKVLMYMYTDILLYLLKK